MLAVSIVLGVVACAHPAVPVAVEPHLVTSVPGDVPQTRPRLGVGRFVDARPRSDRIVRAPRLRLRPYGLVRRGEHQTGDASFTVPVADAVRRDAIATLSRSGAFSVVRAVDVGDADGPPPIPDGLEFVVVATIEELVGIQHQDLQVPFWPLGGYRNRLGELRGLARVRYRLYDTRGLVTEERIDTVLRSHAADPARAALDAVARTNERLAQRLFLRLVPERERVRRRVALRVIDECGLGLARVHLLVRDASGVLEREAGIRLVPEWIAGMRRRFEDLETALAAIRRERRPEGAHVLALVRRTAPESRRFGLADPLGDHAVVACDAEGDVRVVTLAHEIGHLFGALHVRDRASVMHPVAEFDGRFFDPRNREILRTAWARPLGAPLPDRLRGRLARLYRAALEADPIDSGEVELLLTVTRRY